MSNNQLDYILIDEVLNENTFVTSYNNFISDHKSVIFRLGINKNSICKEMKARINFDSEGHLKSNKEGSINHNSEELNEVIYEDKQQEDTLSSVDESMSNEDVEELNDAMYEDPDEIYPKINKSFRRKFNNPDMATCWLNSCLQLVLNAMDHGDDIILDSELGLELKRLQTSNQDLSLNPTVVKEIIVSTEDTRVASRLSRLLATNGNKNQIESESRIIQQSRFDLRNGQQCVRFFSLPQ